MRLIIAGSRTFTNYELFKYVVDKALLDVTEEIEIVSGGAKGADNMAELYASERKLPFKLFAADWSKHGKSAGPIRNKQMAEYGTHLIAFWDGQSRGTENIINAAEDNGVNILTVHLID